MVQLSTAGKVDFDLYDQDIETAGLSRVYAVHLRKASDLPDNSAFLAADLLAAGLQQKEIEVKLGLPAASYRSPTRQR